MEIQSTKQLQRARLDALSAAVGGSLGEEIAAAWADYYTLFTSDVIDWFADLYDARIGGYYYSNSARDTDGYLPDAESTRQALGFFESSGMSAGKSWTTAVPTWMKEQIGRFIYSLQDPDGYFYHPQWGKNIQLSRRARDFSWCISTLEELGIKPRYKTILDTKDTESAGETLIPEHLQSREKFIAYLDTKDFATRSYHVGNELAAQVRQIVARGLAPVCAEYLSRLQDPVTGHWHNVTNYYGINGLMKISSFYTSAHQLMPHPMEAAASAIEAITSAEPMGAVVDLYNTWFAVSNILGNLRTCGGEDGAQKAEEIVETLRRRAPAAIRRSREKIAIFKKLDGSFSYLPQGSSATSQGAPAAVPHSAEGDVNGCVIAIRGIVSHAFLATDLREYTPPLFAEEERLHYIARLEENRRQIT